MNLSEPPAPGGPTLVRVTRRDFLTATAAALVAPRDGTAAPKPLVVDAHMHVWSDGKGRFPYVHPYEPGAKPRGAGSVEMLLDDMDRDGVSHAILVQVIHHGWDNRYLAQCVKDHPKRLKAHGLIDPLDANVADRLQYWVKEQGLAGMRFSPIYYEGRDDWMTSKAHRLAWKKAEALGAVFNFFIATGQLPKLEVMIRSFPGVQVIIDHLSQLDLTLKDPAHELSKLLALSRYPRVWVKVSELASISKTKIYPFEDTYPWVKRVYEAFGPDRLLWGTGYPGTARARYDRPTLGQELTLVRERIPFLTTLDREKILGQNAARLWKLTGPG
jgi:predicted TIM-barrel fold metal-dependent hydrolase